MEGRGSLLSWTEVNRSGIGSQGGHARAADSSQLTLILITLLQVGGKKNLLPEHGGLGPKTKIHQNFL